MNNQTNQNLTLEAALEAFLRSLEGKNRSPHTLTAYRTDLTQFIAWLHDNNIVAQRPSQVERADVTEYLASLSNGGLSGVSRARKLAAIREYFRFLEEHGHLAKSPAIGVDSPRKEKNGRSYLRPEEYNKMLSEAGSNPKAFAILQLFLQTGIRVSELCELRLSDVDVEGRTIRVTAGKGMNSRDIDLERKAIQALKNYLQVRPRVLDDHFFLNRDGEPIGDRGVRKMVVKYREKAGITKKIGPHSLRHTFATHKAEHGISPFQIQQWLGHASLNTTQIYVHMGRQNARKAMEATSL